MSEKFDESILELSDEEIMNMPEPDFSLIEDEPADEPNEEPVGDPEVEGEALEDPPTNPPEEDPHPEEPSDDPPTEDGDTEDGEEKDPPEDDNPPAEEEPSDDSIDYKNLYEGMLKPFKANGREVTPKSAEDLIRLAQMGANYHEKMAGMKPARKALKTLENNDLLDPEKLSFLIDVSKGNPEAINKLMREHNIDPLTVDTKTESTYVPNDHTATDAEVALEEVLTELKGNPSGDATLDIVSNRWDEGSRMIAAQNPEVMRIIKGHVEAGIYDAIEKEMNYRKSMGQLSGMSDFEAYKAIGNDLEAKGLLPGSTPVKEESAGNPVVPPVNQAKENATKAKKKAASPTKPNKSVVKKVADDFNPLDLSDEDFEKFDVSLIGLK